MPFSLFQEDEFSGAQKQGILEVLQQALSSAPNDGTTAGMTPPSERIAQAGGGVLDFARQAFFPDQDFTGPQAPQIPDAVTQRVDQLRAMFVPGSGPSAEPAPKAIEKPTEERDLDDDIYAYQESIIHAESALRGEVEPDKDHTLEILTAATEARGDKPLSVEKKKEVRNGLSRLIDRMNKSDRIDLLSAGLSIMQNANKRTSTGQAIATGLLTGMQVATQNRVEAARQEIASRGVAAREKSADASMIAAAASLQRAGQSGTAAILAAANKNASPEQKAQAEAILANVAPNASEEEIAQLQGFFQRAVRDIQNSGGDMSQVAPYAMQLAMQAGIPIEKDTSFFGLFEGEGIRVGDESPLSSLANLLP